MNNTLEQYIDTAYEYRFTQGPNVIRSREDAKVFGINCISLAHLALYDSFGYKLPPELRCFEMFNDSEHFGPVDSLDQIQLGDLVWFGLENPRVALAEFKPRYHEDGELANWSHCPIKHVAICTGAKDEFDDPLFLHSTNVEGTNVIWPLSKFAHYRRYKKLYAITRLKAAEHNDKPMLKILAN